MEAEKERIRKLLITLGDENKKAPNPTSEWWVRHGVMQVVSQIRGLAAALEVTSFSHCLFALGFAP